MNQSLVAWCRKSETTRHDQGLICCRTCREVPWILVVWIWPGRMLRIQIFPKEIDASCAGSFETWSRCWTCEINRQTQTHILDKWYVGSWKHLACLESTLLQDLKLKYVSTMFETLHGNSVSEENIGKKLWPSHTMTWLHLQTWLPIQ